MLRKKLVLFRCSDCPTKPATKEGGGALQCVLSGFQVRAEADCKVENTSKKVQTFKCLRLEPNILLFLHEECALKLVSQISLF